MPTPAYPAARAVAPRVSAQFVQHLARARQQGRTDLAPEPETSDIEAVIDAAFWASLRREEGVTLIVITHSTDLARRMGEANYRVTLEHHNAAVNALADSQRTRVILVARAQPSALREVERTREELRRVGLNQQYLVINAVMPENETHRDALAAAIYAREQAVLARIPDALRTLGRRAGRRGGDDRLHGDPAAGAVVADGVDLLARAASLWIIKYAIDALFPWF